FGRLLSIRNWDVLTLFLPVPGLLLLIEFNGTDQARWAYLALLGASLYFFVRCLFDLALEKRPALSPNLTLGGLLCLPCGLFAARPGARGPPRPPGDKKGRPADEAVRRPVEDLLRTQPNLAPESEVGAWAERGLALACHLAVVVGLVVIGWRHFADITAGGGAAPPGPPFPPAHPPQPAGARPARRPGPPPPRGRPGPGRGGAPPPPPG